MATVAKKGVMGLPLWVGQKKVEILLQFQLDWRKG